MLNISIFSFALLAIIFLVIYANRLSKNKPKKSHWNYRVGTRIIKTPIRDYREYLIFTCYYTNGFPDSYGISEIGHYDVFEDMQKSFDKIQKAFKKPIIDLDNFPEEFDYKTYVQINDGN